MVRRMAWQTCPVLLHAPSASNRPPPPWMKLPHLQLVRDGLGAGVGHLLHGDCVVQVQHALTLHWAEGCVQSAQQQQQEQCTFWCRGTTVRRLAACSSRRSFLAQSPRPLRPKQIQTPLLSSLKGSSRHAHAGLACRSVASKPPNTFPHPPHLEGQLAKDEEVERDAQRPDVGLPPPVALSGAHLGGCGQGRAQGRGRG